MLKRMTILPWLTVAGIAVSVPALACREPSWTDAEWLQASDQAALALVTGISIPELERPGVRRDINVGFIGATADRQFRLAVIEGRRGQLPSEMTITVGLCGGMFEDVGSRVIAYHVGKSWHLKPAPPASLEEEFLRKR